MTPTRFLKIVISYAMVAVVSSCGGGLDARQTAKSPAIALSPTSLSFGNQTLGTASATQTLKVTNTGTVSATISSVSVDSAGFALAVPPLPLTLAPTQSLQVSVTFQPAISSSFNGWISVFSNGQNSPHSVAVSGSGVVPSTATLAAIPSSLSILN